MELALLFAVGWCVSFGGFGAWISVQKRRPGFEGFAAGAIFGPLGCVIVALLPTITAGRPAARRHRSGRWDYREPSPIDPHDEQIADWLLSESPPRVQPPPIPD